MFEDFINALQNFRQNKTRTFLSLLGVIIGVASVILITTLGQSATENVKKSINYVLHLFLVSDKINCNYIIQ